MVRFPAVLFDLDGTLIDGYPAIAASASAVRAGYGMPALTVNEIRPYVGHGLEFMLASVTPTTDPSRDAAVYREHYGRTMMQGTWPLPGAERLIGDLVASGRKVGVCSNKLAKFTVEILRHLGLAERLGVVVGPEHVANPKPDPEMLLAAADALHVAAADCLYVGDMSVDIAAGRAAGMTVWVVPTGSETRETLLAAGPDRLFPDLNTIREAIFGA